MKRYHAPCCGEDAAELFSIPAEEVYPCACAQAPSCPWEPDRCPCEDGRPTPETGDDCCCKGSMVEALRLLCGSELSELVDFNSFFFLTDALTVGGALQPTLSNQGPADNIEDVDALSLCALKAVAFQLTDDRCEEGECAQERRAIRLIRRAIRREDGDTGACGTCRAQSASQWPPSRCSHGQTSAPLPCSTWVSSSTLAVYSPRPFLPRHSCSPQLM